MIDTDQKNLLIVTATRLQSPMSIEMYRYMQKRTDLPFSTTICHDVPGGTNLREWCARFSITPDAVLGGMGCDFGTFYSFENKKWMDEKGIKKLFQVGDISQTLEVGPAVAAHAVQDWDVIWNVSNGDMRVYSNLKMEEFKGTYRHLQKAKVVYHPWSYSPEIWNCDGRAKDVDVFFSMTLSSNWFNAKRGQMFNALNPLRQKYHVLSGYPDQQQNWHGLYGWPYEEGMKRAKICLVDTAMRNNMTAKYLEAAASGCLLMGDAPWGMDDVFNDDTMAILDYNDLEGDLVKQVEHYLANPEERQRKADRLRDIVEKRFTNEVGIPELETKLHTATYG